MNAQAFWSVIGNYNEQTKIIQIGLLIFVILAVSLSYIQKVNWAAKFALGITNLFIGIVFFAWYGTEPIQNFLPCPYIYFVEFCFYMKAGITRMIYLKNPLLFKAS